MPKFHQLDVSHQKSLDTFSDYVKKEYGGIDLLVNNAAIAYKVR
jgi:carbonyl reductase 1